MKSHTTEDFRRGYANLSPRMRQIARKQFRVWRVNPRHPSVVLKKVGVKIWSARVSEGWRALAVEVPDGYLWFWIGSHDHYMRVIKSV